MFEGLLALLSILSSCVDSLMAPSPEQQKLDWEFDGCTSAAEGTYENYQYSQDANTSTGLHAWNQSRDLNVPFDVALGTLAEDSTFRCGIGFDTQCLVPTCDILAHNQPEWVFYSALSVAHLGEILQQIYNSTSDESLEEDVSKLITKQIGPVFTSKNPLWNQDEITSWVELAVPIAFTGTYSAQKANVSGVDVPIVQGLGLVIAAVQAQLTASLQPLLGMKGQVALHKLYQTFQKALTDAGGSLDTFANRTFAGKADVNNNTIVEYISSGTYTVEPETSVALVQLSYRTIFVGKAVNSYWRSGPNYVVSTSAQMNSSDNYPKNESWFSNATSRRYAAYHYDGMGPKMLPGLTALNNTNDLLYDYTYPPQIPQAAGRAWEAAGHNYTYEVAKRRILDAVASPKTLNPFGDGAGWEGVYTLPVCDVGDHKDWLPEYGSQSTNKLPCCCGFNCVDTRNFIETANLNKSVDFWIQCKKQLHSTDLDFSKIDYGIDAGSALNRFWHGLSRGETAGICIGIIVGCLLVLCLPLWCCCTFRRRRQPINESHVQMS